MGTEPRLVVARPSGGTPAWSAGERVDQLLDAITRVHSAPDYAAIQGVCVDVVERALPGAAAALFGVERSAGVVSLRAAGHRWRTAERDAPAWLADLSGPISNLVRSLSRVGGGLVRSGSSAREYHEGGLRIVQVPVCVDAQPWGSLVVVWPATGGHAAAEEWFVEHLANQVGLALGHAATAQELQRSLVSLRDAQRELVRSEQLRVVGELASGVAHDFNNTLTTVLGTTEWLLHTQTFDPEVRADLEMVRTAATDAAALVKRLHFFGRRAPVEDRQTEDLAEIAEVAVDMVRPRLKELLDRRGTRVEVDLRVRVGEVYVCISDVEIREVLVNLLLNAADAMPDGGRIIVESGRDGETAWLSVTDEGHGMPPEVRTRIFEPFFSTKGKNGTGLGLSVCWDIAAGHGGGLEVESAVGYGSTFTLWLPATDASPGTATAADAQSPKSAVLGSLAVLLVDDQEDVLQSLSDLLTALGHRVEMAATGQEALALLEEHVFDLVITDLGMPGMNGLEVAGSVHRFQHNVPVVLLTGWGVQYEAVPPEGVSLVVPKPVTLESLGAAIERVFLDRA